MNNETIIEVAFVSSEELWRSWRVLSVAIITPSSISIILQMILSLIR